MRKVQIFLKMICSYIAAVTVRTICITLPCWKNYTRNMHVSCMFLQISCVLHHACFMHVPHTMYLHVSCFMHGTCMEHVRNWDVFHACDMYEPCMLHACHYHECTMHEPCMHGLAVVSSPDLIRRWGWFWVWDRD